MTLEYLANNVIIKCYLPILCLPSCMELELDYYDRIATVHTTAWARLSSWLSSKRQNSEVTITKVQNYSLSPYAVMTKPFSFINTMAALTFGSTTGLLTTIYSSLSTGWRNCDNGIKWQPKLLKKQVHYEELEQYLFWCDHTYSSVNVSHLLYMHYVGRNGSSSHAWMTIHISGCCTWRYTMMLLLDTPSHLGLL